ncbi:methylglyoxal synthase [Maritalea sp.]|uniref:methylglyoxal synthase n=1 Tax=Maritalea sp. TaxID=2003361 RepID=UPI003EF47359
MKKSIGLVAHDDKKELLAQWCANHREKLAEFDLYATGTTGAHIVEETELSITLLKSGPLGGDAQLGAMIVENKLDGLIFFIDALTAMPHDVDVKALIRLATLYDVPFACNRSTANAVLGLF